MPKFEGRTARFLTYFCDTEDIKEAAKRSGLTLPTARRLYRDPEVRAEIDRRLDRLHDYQARLRAKAHALGVDLLDTQLVRAVKFGAERGDVKALELGYQRLGMFRDGEFIGVQQPQQPPDPSLPPPIFRVERIVTRMEQVTDRAESTDPAALPAPQVLNY